MLAAVKKTPRRHGAKSSSNENPFPCVIGDRFPDFCDKRFPNIEKHNEHLKRFHSPIFWCKQCLHKFNSSWTEKVLSLDRADHDRNCPGTPSQKNQERRDGCYVMSDDQYNRFESRKWKKTIVPVQPNDNGEKESLPQKSWRQIRETIFPSAATIREESSTAPATSPRAGQNPEEIMAFVNTMLSDRLPMLLTHFTSSGVYAPSVVEPDQTSATNTTAEDMSQFSNVFSETTNTLTQDSTICPSYISADGPRDTDIYDIGGTIEHEPFYGRANGIPDEHQDLISLLRAGSQWDGSTLMRPEDLNDELYKNFDPFHDQSETERQ